MYLAYYVGFALLGLACFALGRSVGRTGKSAALTGYAAILALLIAKAVLNHNPPLEFSLLGWWPDYIFLQSYLIFPLGLTCLGLAAGLLPPGPNRRAVTVLAGFLVVVSLWTERWIFVEPDRSSTARADEQHYCPQSTSYSCGPAACVSLLSQLGIDATEGEMMALCRTPSYGGTSLFRICRGLSLKLGDDYSVRIIDGSPERLQRRGGPAIVPAGRVHAVTLQFTDEGVTVIDPGEGVETITFEEFAERFGGPAVIVDRVVPGES